MPLFAISNDRLASIEQTNFSAEKKLQELVEENIETVFGCRFVASEFSTGAQHAGRIDTLALSEDDNPVIIEYKKVESSALILQSLYYLEWLKSKEIRDLALSVQEFVMSLDPAIEEAPKKLYVAYKMSKNIVSMGVQQSKITYG